MFLFHCVWVKYFCPWNFCTLRFCIYYLAITAITAKTLMLNLQILRTRKPRNHFPALAKPLMMGASMRKETSSSPILFYFFQRQNQQKHPCKKNHSDLLAVVCHSAGSFRLYSWVILFSDVQHPNIAD